jgi:hypothetical protein
MNRQFSLIFVLFVFCGTIELFGLGAQDEPSFFLANGTGSNISKIQIIPSAEKYPNSGKSFNLIDVKLEDIGVLGIYLPDDMKGYDLVDITVQCGFRKYSTKQSVDISKTSDFPIPLINKVIGLKPQMLSISKKGKDSTFITACGAGAGGVIGVAGITTAVATTVGGSVIATGSIGGSVPLLITWATLADVVIVGGTTTSIVAGVAVVAAIPLAAAAVVGGITWGIYNLIPGELVVEPIKYKAID